MKTVKSVKREKPHRRSCAACGLLETKNVVDGKVVPFRLDAEKRPICATCPLEVVDE
jgi:hypothetical protein